MAGKIKGVVLEGGDKYLDMMAEGTQSESLLRDLSGRPQPLLCVPVDLRPLCPWGDRGAEEKILLLVRTKEKRTKELRVRWGRQIS